MMPQAAALLKPPSSVRIRKISELALPAAYTVAVIAGIAGETVAVSMAAVRSITSFLFIDVILSDSSVEEDSLATIPILTLL